MRAEKGQFVGFPRAGKKSFIGITVRFVAIIFDTCFLSAIQNSFNSEN